MYITNGTGSISWTLGVALASIGGLISTVLLTFICLCCKGTSVPQHKAKVVKNVVAEEDSKTLQRRRSGQGNPRPSSMIFVNKVVGIGQWSDLTRIDEAKDVPDRFRSEKPAKPENPPDVILHPSMRSTLLADARNDIRPRSTLVHGTPSNPETILQSRNVEQPEAEDGHDYVNQEIIIKTKKRPKSEFPLRDSGNQPDVLEIAQKKDRDKPISNSRDNDVTKAERTDHSQRRKESRGRIQSSGDVPPDQEKLMRSTPSDPGIYEGIHQNETSRWGDDVEDETTRGNPPPLPTRKYLLYKQESEPDVLENDTSQGMKQKQNIDQSTQTTQTQPLNVDDLKHLPGYRALERDEGKSPSSMSPQRENTAKQVDPHQVHSPINTPSRRPLPGTPERVILRGESNDAFEEDDELPDQVRDGRINPGQSDIHPSRRPGNVKLRKRPSPYGDQYYSPYRQVSLRHPQRHRRIDDAIDENSYDFYQPHIVPGGYIRPKPYYKFKGPNDATKRFSDASDYSDIFYTDSAYYVDPVNKDYEDYFFRSRWSITPDQTPEDFNLRRRNSDFTTEQANHGFPLGVFPPNAPPRPRSQRHHQHRLSLIELPNEARESDIVRDYPQPRRGLGPNSSGGPSPNKHLQPAIHFNSPSSRRRFPDPPHRQQLFQPQPGPLRTSSNNSSARPPISPESRRRGQWNNSTNIKTPIPHKPTNPGPPIPERRQRNQKYLQIPNQKTSIENNNPASPYEFAEEGYSGVNPPSFTTHPTPADRSDQMDPNSVQPPTIAEGQPNPRPPVAKRQSSKGDNFIDILIRYRQGLENIRREKMDETTKGGIERDKLQEKLREELSVEQRQSKNVEMIVEALLFLCENDKADSSKRSWQRNRASSKISTDRPSSDIYIEAEKSPVKTVSNSITPSSPLVTNSVTRVPLSESPLEKDVYSKPFKYKIRPETSEHDRDLPKHSDHDATSSKHSEPKETKPPNHTRWRQRHNYCEIELPGSADNSQKNSPKSDPVTPYLTSVPHKEPPFPSVEEVEAILNKDDSDSPPVPPPRYKKAAKYSDVNNRNAPNPNMTSHNPQKLLSPHNIEEIPPLNERRKRSSLPSLQFTDSELQWLSSTDAKVPKSAGLAPDFSGQRIISSNTNNEPSSEKYWSPYRPKKSTDGIKINLNEIIGDKQDAEDIIKAVEGCMTPETSLAKRPLTPRHTKAPYVTTRNIYSESDAGNKGNNKWDEAVPSPPRRQFVRSMGVHPGSKHSTPNGSPALSSGFHTPKKSESPEPPPVPPRRESSSPKIHYPVFITPPPSPHTRSPSPSVMMPRSSKITSPNHSGDSTPISSPKILPPQKVQQFTPKKVHDPTKSTRHQSIMKNKSHKQAFPNKHAPSPPLSPAINPLSPKFRLSSKLNPKLPFTGRKFTTSHPNNPESPKIPESQKSPDNRRVSRTGELITIPPDDVYALPFDCIPRNQNDVSRRHGPLSPPVGRRLKPPYDVATGVNAGLVRRHSQFHSNKSAFSHFEKNRFHPIREDIIEAEMLENNSDYDDYAIPVNLPPSTLLRHKRSKSFDDLLEIGTAL